MELLIGFLTHTNKIRVNHNHGNGWLSISHEKLLALFTVYMQEESQCGDVRLVVHSVWNHQYN